VDVYVSLRTSGKDVIAYSLEMAPDLNPDGLQCKLNNERVRNSKSKVTHYEGTLEVEV
jgi:hypothetical protein